MAGNLGSFAVEGVIPVPPGKNLYVAGGWLVTFTPDELPMGAPVFEIFHGALRGPGGLALVYIDDRLYDVIQNGLLNAYEPTQPMYVQRGQEISFHWSIATTPAPKVWLYARIPEVGRI
jgi:hypothetical protein